MRWKQCRIHKTMQYVRMLLGRFQPGTWIMTLPISCKRSAAARSRLAAAAGVEWQGPKEGTFTVTRTLTIRVRYTVPASPSARRSR